MDVIRRISARDSSAILYAKYLESPEWRARRQKKLQDVGWRCEACNSKRELQVHHLTYERVGRETDADLKVLCATCHEGQHPEASGDQFLGLYLKLAREILTRATQFERDADLLDAFKARCAQLHIPYRTEKLAHALTLVRQRLPQLVVAPAVEKSWNSRRTNPPTAFEARRILEQLCVSIGLRAMPEADSISPRDADRQRAMALIEQEILESLKRCAALEAEASA